MRYALDLIDNVMAVIWIALYYVVFCSMFSLWLAVASRETRQHLILLRQFREQLATEGVMAWLVRVRNPNHQSGNGCTRQPTSSPTVLPRACANGESLTTHDYLIVPSLSTAPVSLQLHFRCPYGDSFLSQLHRGHHDSQTRGILR